MFCDNLDINEMNPGMAGFLVAKKRMVELNGGMQQGIVYLLGAGPGDPGLITVRGRELVGMAEVLVYDALSSAEMLNWAPAACERILWASGLPATPCRRRKSTPCWSGWAVPGKKWCA